MTETFREISRNMQANEEHRRSAELLGGGHRLRTNPAELPADGADSLPMVSVVLVNYKGADDTIVCLKALRQLDWPADRFEMIVVDNASGDGGAAPYRRGVC